MSISEPLTRTDLPSVYDEGAFSSSDFSAELADVQQQTAIERAWIRDYGVQTYDSDHEIIRAAERGQLVKVGQGAGYMAIQKLLHWEIDRTDPTHPWHYSAPYLRPEASDLLKRIGNAWQDDMGEKRYLSVTSMVRSAAYQRRLTQQFRKLTVASETGMSSHQAGLAFDIDGIGLKEIGDDGDTKSINPRFPQWNPRLAAEGQMILRILLDEELRQGNINYVEELPGTQEHCFHICVKPS